MANKLPDRSPSLNYEELVDRVPGMVGVYNIHTGEYTYVNSAVKKLLGYSPNEFRSRGLAFVTSLVHPDDIPRIMAENKKALVKASKAKADTKDNEPIVSFEYRMRHKRGHWVWLHTDGSVYSRTKDGTVNQVLNISIDITDRKKSEDALRQISEETQTALNASQQKYQAFISNSNEGIWRFELEKPIPVKLSPSAQVKLMYERAYLAEANQALATMYGARSVKSLLGKRLGDFLVPDDPANIEYLTRFIRCDYRLSGVQSHEKDSQGNDKYFRNSLVGEVINGHIVRAWGTQQDITEQYLATKSLKHSQVGLALALKASKMGMWEWNILTGELIWSEELRRIYGLKPQEKVTYEKYQSLLHPDDQPLVLRLINQAVQDGKGYKLEHRIIWPDGSLHWVLGQGQAILKDGKAKRMLGTAMNIDDRKKIEQEREAAIQEANNFFNLPNLLLCIADTDGYFKRLNPAWERMLGYTSKYLTSRPWIEFVHPDDKESTIAEGKKLQTGKPTVHFQNRYRCKNGTYKWLNWDVRPVGKVLYAAAQDITPIKQIEEKLRESEERLALAQQAANIGTFEWNIRTDEVLWNTELATLYGIPVKEFGGTFAAWVGLLHTKDRARVKLELQKAVNNKQELNTEFRITCPDGETRWLNARGRAFYDGKGEPLRLLGINRNVTKRKMAEEKLKQSEEQFRQLADSMPQMVWTARPDGYLDYYNKQWYEFTGFKEGYGDQSWRPILHPDDVDFCVKTWYHSVETGKPYQIEYRFKDRKKPGSYRWFLGRALPIKDKNGNILKWFGTCTDIDEVKRTTKRKNELEEMTISLKEQRAQLVALNKAKDEFISLASHQLRTPATGVKQYIGMLIEGYGGKLTKQQLDILKTAYDSNERQLKIVGDLLKVAHVDAGRVMINRQKSDLGIIIKDVTHEQQAALNKKNQKLVCKLPDKPVMAFIDPYRIRMVLENVLDNASKYTTANKRIIVELKELKRNIHIIISDEGVGIDERDIPKLFYKFSRIDNPLSTTAGGTGLGLYWAKKIVDLHGGAIAVKSVVDKGTSFIIKIPKEIK